MPYTADEVSETFPVDSTSDLMHTINRIDDLVQAGVFDDNDLRQVLPVIGAALDTNIEHVVVQSAVYSGTAGSVTRDYFSVPIYPLPIGGAQNYAGKYLNQLTEDPGGGRNLSKQIVSQNDMQKGFIGGSQASPPTAVTVANTAAELDGESNFVTIVAPASSASAVTGVNFDIFASIGALGSTGKQAIGSVQISSTDGAPTDGESVSIAINGSATNVPLSGTASDANMVAELVNAINANTAVNTLVTARAGTNNTTGNAEVVIVANAVGTAGNAITLSATANPTSGAGFFTLTVSGATLTGGVNATSGASAYLVASNVAAGATVVDGGQVSRPYTLPLHTQYAVDKSGSTPVPITGLRTVLPTN